MLNKLQWPVLHTISTTTKLYKSLTAMLDKVIFSSSRQLFLKNNYYPKKYVQFWSTWEAA